jgi:hypothetical protein
MIITLRLSRIQASPELLLILDYTGWLEMAFQVG